LLVLVVVAALVLGGRWLWTQRAAVASPSDRVATSGSGGADEAAEAAGANRSTTAAQEEGAGGGEADAAGSAAVGDASASVEGEGTGAGTGSAGLPDATTAAAGLVVHVAGEVLQPGVVELPPGSRLVDAVRSAGGVTDAADQSTLNLARPLVDGERVWVGRPGETPPQVAAGPAPSPASRGGGETGAGAGAGTTGGAAAAPLDLNAATQADLEELPGVGPVTAGHILGWREEHGRFSSVDELLEVSGIGERTLAQLEPLVTVGG
jgi:competence protein ComEA